MNGKELQKTLIEKGAEAVRLVNETGRTVTIEIKSLRTIYEADIEPFLDSQTWELRGIEEVQNSDKPSERTGKGTYRYTAVIFK